MLKKIIAENLYDWEKRHFAFPVQLSITPTNLCNLRCQSCWQRNQRYNPSNRPQEVSEKRLYDVIEEAAVLKIRCIEITGGGEPFARKSLTIQLIERIKKKNMMGWMTSNGTLFSKDIIELMVGLGWDKLTISLDGPDAETNDFLRPPSGTFKSVLNTLKLFQEQKKIYGLTKPDITFNVVLSKYNIDKLEGFIDIAEKSGVCGITFEPVKILADKCKDLLMDFENDYDHIRHKLISANEHTQSRNIFTNIKGLTEMPELIKYSGKLMQGMPIAKQGPAAGGFLNVPCIEPWFHIYIEADGNVRPCCVNEGLGENINNNNLKDIWLGEKFSLFRQAIINGNYPLSCDKCNANLICFSREIQSLLKDMLNRSPLINRSPDSLPEGTAVKKSGKQKKISLVVTDTAPLYPPLWGGPKRIWSLYGNLSQDLFDITYVGVKTGLGNGLKYSFNKIRDNFKEILCAFPAHYYFWHAFEKTIFRNTSLDLFAYLLMHTDWQFKYILNSQNADVVIFSHPWSSLCLNKRNTQFFIYDAHNCEYLLMGQILGDHFLKGPVLRRVYKIEQEACKRSNLILACSEKEKNDLIKLYKLNPDKIVIVTNGTAIRVRIGLQEKQLCKEALKIQADEKVVVFIGAYYKPNIDALKFIINKIVPFAKDMKFLILGTVCDFLKGQPLPQNVVLLGKVSEEQLDIALKASDIAINPMFNGSGINIKMLDYMAYGLPIVTTECGARGIETDGRQPMIVSDVDNFVENIKILSNDSRLYERLSKDGRTLAAEYYDWSKISNGLENIILDRLGTK